MANTMGWCHEFGPQIAETCEHPMTAHSDHCECTVCGTVCTGRFAGCGAVWARGPREVSVSAPHFGRSGASREGDGDRWRLPLAPPRATASAGSAATTTTPTTTSSGSSLAPVKGVPSFETPDVTTRYAVAQLEELNARVATLTTDTTERNLAALEKVSRDLERITTQREVDLTDQAAGIFTAVQAAADQLAMFSRSVTELTADLRVILEDALKSIGGTDGLAAWVATSVADLSETREDLLASLGRVERDLTLLRRRTQAGDAKPAKLDDDQVAFIIDAVTESVLAAIDSGRRKK